MSNPPLIGITIPGLRDMQGRFARWEETLGFYRLRHLQSYSNKALKVLKKNAPKGKTKRLSDSIQKVVGHYPHESIVRFFVSPDQAQKLEWVLEGTPPHEITAIRRKVLKFNIGDENLFRRSVFHPGMKPNDFVAESLVELGPSFITEMNKAGVRALLHTAGKYNIGIATG